MHSRIRPPRGAIAATALLLGGIAAVALAEPPGGAQQKLDKMKVQSGEMPEMVEKPKAPTVEAPKGAKIEGNAVEIEAGYEGQIASDGSVQVVERAAEGGGGTTANIGGRFVCKCDGKKGVCTLLPKGNSLYCKPGVLGGCTRCIFTTSAEAVRAPQ